MVSDGTVFAGYLIDRQLGRGGMGSVYLARHPRLPRRIALKLLNPELFSDIESRARFEREADLAAQLEHPNIVTVYDRGIDGGHLWISMQFVDGVDAATIEHPVPAERALRIIEGTAAALDHAHRNGVLHRDVKPANILLADNDGKERVLLTDFGIARPRDDVHHLTQTGTFTATLAYASPEQLTGAHLDHRSDQYSLACTLYALLTGTTPFEATNPAVVIQGHLQSPPPSLRARRADLPAALDAVLARALAKRPADRFSSCAEFAAAARGALGATGARPTVVASSPSSPRVPPPAPFGQVPAPVYVARSVGQALHPAPLRHPGFAPPAHRTTPGRSTGRRVAMTMAAVIVCALTVGIGMWAWQDEDTFVAEILRRTPGHKELAALSDAYPALLPSGSGDGDGYEGRSCTAARGYERYEQQWMRRFDGFSAKWHCTISPLDGTHYAVFAYPTAEKAAEVVGRFLAETDDRGESTSGTRTDRLRARKTVELGIYEGSAVLATDTAPGRERWVMLFYYDATGPNQATLRDTIEPKLCGDVARFPLS
ncbi:serine/threonine-protein kinase [Nocardia asteroides]|uniref:serine/threonine-protein kinase n=1 Tax=Nocardia asteroides TaxID=1824 RepID=UPI001E4A71D1|nr:serine/threonine-protein kinase [Nocardia asteroides]UGT56836.1 serine/threonine protein kinase [Nocardia asteroides]